MSAPVSWSVLTLVLPHGLLHCRQEYQKLINDVIINPHASEENDADVDHVRTHFNEATPSHYLVVFLSLLLTTPPTASQSQP